MNLSKTIEESERCELVIGESGLERAEGGIQSLTPIKRSTLSASNFYSTLSPLPLPPKMEHPNQESVGSYSKELMYVETPVAKESNKLPIQEEEEMQCDGIVNRIIFESSDEDRHNHSSSAESEDDDSEEDSENSDIPIVEDDLSQEEESKMIEEEDEEEEEFSGEGQKDLSKDHHNKTKRTSKSRANLSK